MASNRFYITANTLIVEPNQYANPNMVRIATNSRSVLSYYAKTDGVTQTGLDATAYPEWAILAQNLQFPADCLHTNPAYLYAMLPLNGRTAFLRVFAARKEVSGTPYFDGDYYFVCVGEFSAIDTSSLRTFTPDFGIYITDDGGYVSSGESTPITGMFNLVKPEENPTTWYIQVLKDLLQLRIRENLEVGGSFTLDDTTISSILSTAAGSTLNTASDTQLITALRVLTEIADNNEVLKEMFLRKDVADSASGLITFLQGLKSLGSAEFGDFVSGMLTGKGGRIDAQGNAEFQSAVIRGSMKVMELLINRLYAIESDYVYTEADTVEEVEEVGDKTYRLTLRRKYDGYFTAQKENNVLFGVINSLANGSGGEYYTAWSRVLSVNTTDNTITVVMYPDNEVPDGVNYPPTKGMVLARKGSSDSPLDGSHNERQDFWSMSSSDGRLLFLQNVAKPILEEYYYTLSIGKLPELEKFKALPIGKEDTAVYAKNIVAENYYQIDASGNVQTQEVYRGAWSADVAAGDQPYRRIVNDVTTPTGSTSHVLAVHTVYHRGCKWACLTDMTTLEPKWNSPAWQFLEGDSNYSIRFSAYPSGRVRINAVNMVITARVYYGNLDITDELLALPGTDIQWTRNSGIIPEDNAWHPALGATKNILNITNQDMATNWLTVQRVGFVITVFIPTGDGTYYQATDELPLTI